MKRIFKDLFFILAFAVYWESISSEFWIYDARISKFSLFGAFPAVMILLWYVVFVLSLTLSEGVFKSVTKQDSIPVFDKNLYVFDILAFGLIGMTFEGLLNVFGLLQYSPDLDWTAVPVLRLPINTITGYFGIGMFVPTTLRAFRNLSNDVNADSE